MARTRRPKQPLVLEPAEREQLQRWARRPKTEQRLATRSGVVLRCADGLDNDEVAAELGVHAKTVSKWRRRFLERRLDGLEDVLGGVDGVGPEYRIVLERPEELDVLTIEIESEEPTAAQVVRERVKLAVGVSPTVVVHPPNTLPVTEFKSRRVVDLRRVAAGSPVGDSVASGARRRR